MDRREFIGAAGSGVAAAVVGDAVLDAVEDSSDADRAFVIDYLRKKCVAAALRGPAPPPFDPSSVKDFNVSLKIRGDELFALNAQAIFQG